MQPAVKEYKAIMKSDLRSRSFLNIYLGVINRNAQQSAYSESEFTDYSNANELYGNPTFEAYYAVPEQNFSKVDGSAYFLPKDKSMYALYQGAVTKELLGEVEFKFGISDLDIKGLTIDFGEYYPTAFNIITDSKTVNITSNTSSLFETEEVFNNVNSIRIVPISMIGGQMRMRIFSILFGVGLQFTNTEIKSSSRIDKKSQINDEVPSIEFSFTVENINKKFNKDNPSSYSNFLEQRQPCEYTYGRELSDGSIYHIKGGNTLLKSWSSDDSIAKFVTVNRLYFMEDMYYKGKYYANGITLYDLAVLVFNDAEITEYYIDPYLKDIIVNNPLPQTTHKACLQIIANAGRCVLGEDRTGKIIIYSSFMPNVTSVSSNIQEKYSKVENIIQDIVLSKYADCSKDFTQVDGSQFFIGTPYLENGYISPISDENGEFVTNPQLTIEFESQTKMYGFGILFGGSVPEEIKVHQYNNGVHVAELTVTDLDMETIINDELEELDKIVIEITKVMPYSKARIDHISFGEVTDYTLTYNELIKTPSAIDIDKISNILLSLYKYTEGTELKELSTVSISAGSNTIMLYNPSHGYTISSSEGTASIVSSGAYYVEVESSIDQDIVISGYEYNVSETFFNKVIGNVGSTEKWKNPLISSKANAVVLAEWIAEYFSNDIEYDLTYRGDPRIDSNDQIFLENNFVSKNLIRVCSNQIDTESGMSTTCKINGRRVSYVVNT